MSNAQRSVCRSIAVNLQMCSGCRWFDTVWEKQKGIEHWCIQTCCRSKGLSMVSITSTHYPLSCTHSSSIPSHWPVTEQQQTVTWPLPSACVLIRLFSSRRDPPHSALTHISPSPPRRSPTSSEMVAVPFFSLSKWFPKLCAQPLDPWTHSDNQI